MPLPSTMCMMAFHRCSTGKSTAKLSTGAGVSAMVSGSMSGALASNLPWCRGVEIPCLLAARAAFMPSKQAAASPPLMLLLASTPPTNGEFLDLPGVEGCKI